MEKISDLTKEFKEYAGDFKPLPLSCEILGFKNLVFKDKNGKDRTMPALLVKREDGLEITLFADQLRKEGGALFVSAAHFDAQAKRAEEWERRARASK